MADEARSRLGRGLASLIGDVGGEAAHVDRPRAQRKVPIEFLKPNPRNPRRAFSDAELGELTELDQAAWRDPADRGAAGEGRPRPLRDHRRRAALARLAGAPGCTRCRSSRSTSATATRWNSPSSRTSSAKTSTRWKRRSGYHALADEFKRSQEDIAKIVGKSRSHVANTMRLTKLPAEVQAYIAAGKLSAGHARALIGGPIRWPAAKQIVEQRPQRAPDRGAGA